MPSRENQSLGFSCKKEICSLLIPNTVLKQNSYQIVTYHNTYNFLTKKHNSLTITQRRDKKNGVYIKIMGMPIGLVTAIPGD